MLPGPAGKSWLARYGQELGKQEPIATLSGATLALQTMSMLQAFCWPTWPSSPSVNQAALTAHPYKGQPLVCPMQVRAYWLAPLCFKLDSCYCVS